jgi:structural maintenance of chromosome 1
VQDVTKAEYLSELGRFGLNVRAKNFMIFQGQIELLATMSPMDLTALLEELSGYVLKPKYVSV